MKNELNEQTKESWGNLKILSKELSSGIYRLRGIIESMESMTPVFNRYKNEDEAFQVKDFLTHQLEFLSRELKKIPVKRIYRKEHYLKSRGPNGEAVYEKSSKPLTMNIDKVMWADESEKRWRAPKYRNIYSSIDPLVEIRPEDAEPVYRED